MGWLPRKRPRSESRSGGAEVRRETVRPAPGLASLFGDLPRNGDLTLLDLGEATDANLQFYGRFARRIRFADLPGARRAGVAPGDRLAELGRGPEAPYDLVLAWNVLDLLGGAERRSMVDALAEIVAPGAYLHALVDLSGTGLVQPMRFSILDGHRVTQIATGPPQTSFPELVPADVDRLLSPFRVMRAFLLRDGLREYVAARDVGGIAGAG